jgi:hypothetical protein
VTYNLGEKPVVRYKGEVLMNKPGFPAFVTPIDHPNPEGLVSNTKQVLTSPVVSYDEKTGRLETLNTIYIKVEA